MARNLVVRLLSLAVAACLAVDAYVHLVDAPAYTGVRTAWLSQAELFRIEAAVSIVVAVAVLVLPRLWTFALAAVVLGSAFGAVVLYTYVDPGPLGPLPDMYEPAWSLPGKMPSAWAEGIGFVLAVAGAVLTLRRRHAAPAGTSTQSRGYGTLEAAGHATPNGSAGGIVASGGDSR